MFGIPGFLWALPLAAAPLAAHLIFRRKAKRLFFGDLTLLKRAYSRVKPLSRLRDRLLVAARCLILLLLLLAYAKPILTDGYFKSSAEPRQGIDLVLILDTSYSMRLVEDGKTRFEQSVAIGRDILSKLGPEDRAALIAFSDRVEHPSGGFSWMSPAQAAQALAAAKAGFKTTDYAPVLKAAQNFLNADKTGRRQVIMVLSDGCAHGLKSPLPPIDNSILRLGLLWPNEKNAYIASIVPKPGADNLNPRLSIVAGGISRASGREISIRQNDQRLPDVFLSGSGADRTATAALLPADESVEASAWSGRAALRPDALREDDKFFYSFLLPRRPHVLCLYDSPDFFALPRVGYFLRPLFAGPGPSLLPFSVDFRAVSNLPELNLARYQIVMVADANEISTQGLSLLKKFTERGGGLILVPGTNPDPETLSKLSSWLCAGIGPAVPAEKGGIEPGKDSPQSPWSGFDLSRVSLGRYHLLQVKPETRIILASASGYPLLTQGSLKRGRTILWAAPLNAAVGNLALKPIFLAWLKTALDAALPAGAIKAHDLSLKIGEPIIQTWPPDAAAPNFVRVRRPDGKEAVVWLKNRILEFTDTSEPGLYTINAESEKPRAYAVNLDRSSGESDLSPFKFPPWTPIPAASAAARFKILVYGQAVRGALLILAAFLLALEMLLALGPRVAAAIALTLFLTRPSAAQQGDRFTWTQLKLGQTWDPYPGIEGPVLDYVARLTSILVFPKRRILTLDDPKLFSSPMVILAGRVAPPHLSAEQSSRLRDYLSSGGFLWIEDVSGSSVSSFDQWVHRMIPEVLNGTRLENLKPDHVIYKTFFLLRGPSGRVMVEPTLEGARWDGRTAVIYSRNDILGAWALDPLGRPLYPCAPGGEAQRIQAQKLALNIILFSLTGTYKDDAVHQPYLLMKMRSGIP
ncbi:MAG: DUF4159 domain-containing protein [Elusimicrobiota bacterium]